MQKVFTRTQWRVFWGLFIGYAAAYLGRLNLSAALGGIITDMQLTDAQGGVFQTGFALVYAAGQLVNGLLVDKINARRYILTGLMLSALMNALFGFMRSYEVMLVVWCLNGAAQSMLWTPVVKLMAMWFHGKARSIVSFAISITLVAGHLAAWAMSGYLAVLFGWRLSFFIPAALLMLFAVVVYLLIQDRPYDGDVQESEELQVQPLAHRAMPIKPMLLKTGLGFILLACVANGFVRDGVITWAPTIIGDMRGDAVLGNSVLFSLIIPLLNLVGILIGRYIYAHKGESARWCVGVLMLVSAGLSLCVMGAVNAKSMLMSALMLGTCCAATYGINPMLTTLIPMEYDPVGRVGLVAGLVDSFIYLGSSLAGIATGALSDMTGWIAVFISWCVVGAVGSIFAFLSARGRKRIEQGGQI